MEEVTGPLDGLDSEVSTVDYREALQGSLFRPAARVLLQAAAYQKRRNRSRSSFSIAIWVTATKRRGDDSRLQHGGV